MNYTIETSEDENPIGYVKYALNGISVVISTCAIIGIYKDNSNAFVPCSDFGSNSLC